MENESTAAIAAEGGATSKGTTPRTAYELETFATMGDLDRLISQMSGTTHRPPEAVALTGIWSELVRLRVAFAERNQLLAEANEMARVHNAASAAIVEASKRFEAEGSKSSRLVGARQLFLVDRDGKLTVRPGEEGITSDEHARAHTLVVECEDGSFEVVKNGGGRTGPLEEVDLAFEDLEDAILARGSK